MHTPTIFIERQRVRDWNCVIDALGLVVISNRFSIWIPQTTSAAYNVVAPRRPVTDRKYLITGIVLIAIGLVVAIGGSFLVHMAEAPEVDSLGRELYPGVPRGWVVVLIAQIIALGGVVVAMAGITIGFIWNRTLTWARAMLGALVFTGFMFILFAVIPNQFLTLAQSTLEWTPQRVFITVPAAVVMNNDVAISYAALKDMIAAGYVTTLILAIPVAMWWWQGREDRKSAAKPTPVSNYGRPMRVDR